MGNPRYHLNQAKFLSSEELARLEALLFRTLKTRFKRDAILIFLALRTGGRASEILNVQVQDFDPRHSTVHLRGLKGSSDREVPIPRWLTDTLLKHISQNPTLLNPEARIFPITYTRFRQIWSDYRPCKKKLHALRHTFAMKVYEATTDVKLVQLALGHRRLENTQIYVDFCYSRQQMLKIVDCFDVMPMAAKTSNVIPFSPN